MKLSELLEQWKGREQKLQLNELVLVLSSATLLLYIFKTNLFVIGIFVCVLLILLLFYTPNIKLVLLTGVIGGIIGFLTEVWGCSS